MEEKKEERGMIEIIEKLTALQADILGEIANISMGNAATTLSMMVNRKVDITTPYVAVIKRSEALNDYEKTCIFVQIHYVKGLDGNNVLILKEDDVKVLTDLMMGGSGQCAEGELNELHLSAVSEAMNQMMGTAATSLSALFNISTDISTPEVTRIDVESVKAFERMFNSQNDRFVKVSFRMTVEDLIDSTMVQLYPIGFAVDMIEKFDDTKKRQSEDAMNKIW
ncbi:MAG: flagellar motor switch phosphatase FliY [Lachnospiraceae bacterium]|nr:flagellar motor switch phosphatase FliY [Lachnospiraceae bacterium]